MLSSYILLSRVHITHNFSGSKYEDARGEISGYLLDNIVVSVSFCYEICQGFMEIGVD